ncbi:hypothetical protein BXZ70DRAFT_962614 [Cristinia sonorae]|uniref:Uncharacterized protein n=1 Tax=Cristinia sonorae TaxID=1940300 RepID=A0A8K0UEL1_9AGAR|nr:hypothetical protein BXZ70DRAFT_962614 [Cristinia sonorae]
MASLSTRLLKAASCVDLNPVTLAMGEPEAGLANVEWVVIDEADVLLDPDFQESTRLLPADIAATRGHPPAGIDPLFNESQHPHGSPRIPIQPSPRYSHYLVLPSPPTSMPTTVLAPSRVSQPPQPPPPPPPHSRPGMKAGQAGGGTKTLSGRSDLCALNGASYIDGFLARQLAFQQSGSDRRAPQRPLHM